MVTRWEKGGYVLKQLSLGLVVVALAAMLPGATAQEYAPSEGLHLELVASNLDSPLYLTAPPNDPRLFVVEQVGRIRIVQNGTLLAAPFLDIRSKIRSGGERGLLSVAFHPEYAANGFFYVNYTNLQGDTHVERYRVGADANVADANSAKLLLTVDQPFSNHNGGLNLFGPDGMLWIGMGDGGSGGDPQGNGQKRSTLLGKMLRIDVDGADPYAIPPDNPFVNQDDSRPEIWALGLRNPWRFAFDRAANLLYIADVGQNRLEEINVVPLSPGGFNFGWKLMEGTECYQSSNCDRAGLTLPVAEYGRDDGCSVTGGLVYRGNRIPAAVGHYFFADYCEGWIRSFKYGGGAVTEKREWIVDNVGRVLSFGEDASGELYVMVDRGRVYRLAPEN
jgi:glucose/arabinose dehydrogenase